MLFGAFQSFALGLLASQAVRVVKRREHSESEVEGGSHSHRSDLKRRPDEECLVGVSPNVRYTGDEGRRRQGYNSSKIHRTSLDATWTIEAAPGFAIGRIQSWHSNAKEDRNFTFDEVAVVPSFRILGTPSYLNSSDSHWRGWANEVDGEADQECKKDYIVTGIKSFDDNSKDDRRWKLRCSRILTNLVPSKWVYSMHEVDHYSSDWVNEFDGRMDVGLPHGSLMVGMTSYHNNKHEDRKFKISYKKFCGHTL